MNRHANAPISQAQRIFPARRIACAAVLGLLLACAPVNAAENQTLNSQATAPETAMLMKSVEMIFLTFDSRTGNPYVRINRGRSHGLATGDAFLVFRDGSPAGALTLDSVLAESCAGLLQGAPPLPSQNLPLAVDLVPQNHAPPAPGRGAMAGPGGVGAGGMQITHRGSRSLNEPWRPEYDSPMNAVFRAFAQTGAAPIIAPPPSLDKFAPPPESSLLASNQSSTPQTQYRVRELDPEFAREIKSGFFVEPGDCLHIAPWPGIPAGRFLVVDQAQTIELPGPRFVSTNGKSLSRLEKEIGGLMAQTGEQQQPAISPCIAIAPTQDSNPE